MSLTKKDKEEIRQMIAEAIKGQDTVDNEEPKDFWHILPNGGVINKTDNDNALRQEFIEDCKEIGNYFKTEEEAEKAVERLHAWKRLKDKGFEFTGLTRFYTGRGDYPVNYSGTPVTISFNKSMDVLGQDWIKDNENDLDLLFSQEDD